MSVLLPEGYENKVLTGDKLYTLIGLIKNALADRPTSDDVLDLIDGQREDEITRTDDILGDDQKKVGETITTLNGSEVSLVRTDGNSVQTSSLQLTSDGITTSWADDENERFYSAWYGSNGMSFSVENEKTGEELKVIDIFVDENGITLDGSTIATLSDIPDDLAGLTDDSTHRLVSDTEKTTWNNKQDALTFNTAYNASSNKVATMADIPNVSGFQTAGDVQTAISTALSGITSFSFEIVQALPQSNISQTTIYLVLKSSGSNGNVYTEYAYVKTGTDDQTGEDIFSWETLGDTQADIAVLSTAEVQALWNANSNEDL